ncbi:MAG: hypothetical protein ABSD31_18400 [Candidatus Binataceae bacterium]|jgi:hypothetical protein
MAASSNACGISVVSAQIPEFAGVFRGRELTRKERRLSSNLQPVNDLLGGGIPRGRISEIIGRQSSGKTSIAASFIAAATQRGETSAVIDAEDAFDPLTMAAAGVDLNRVLWAAARSDVSGGRRASSPAHPMASAWKAAELILAAGGFGLLVLDFGGDGHSIPNRAALRIARLAERSGTSVLILASRRMCGTFAAVSLALSRGITLFDGGAGGGPSLFDGFGIEAIVTRNKLGGAGGRGRWRTVIDPWSADSHAVPNRERAWLIG